MGLFYSLGFAETIAPPFACLERQMGYDGRPIGSDLTIVTVVLQYGVFPTQVDAVKEILNTLALTE